MQRCMYVLFSRQNTKIGCFIRVFLRNSRYSHVALSLDEKLYTVYSFSRKRHDSPFSGGFMREYPVHYIINAMDVPIKLCRVDMTEEEYCQESHSLQIVQSHGLHIEPNPAWGHCPGDSTF